MLKATSAVALNAPENGIPVPLLERMTGLTITMYDIVTNVVTPPTMSRFNRFSGFSRFSRFSRFSGSCSVGSSGSDGAVETS